MGIIKIYPRFSVNTSDRTAVKVISQERYRQIRNLGFGDDEYSRQIAEKGGKKLKPLYVKECDGHVGRGEAHKIEFSDNDTYTWYPWMFEEFWQAKEQNPLVRAPRVQSVAGCVSAGFKRHGRGAARGL